MLRVLNDRTQAAGCLKEGEISFLIYRRLATFCEEKGNEDLIEKKLKMNHYLMFSDPEYFPNHHRRELKELQRQFLKFSGVSSISSFSKKK